MEWDDKIKLVQLGNKKNYSDEDKESFQNFVVDNIDSFDEQAWDMFTNIVDIISDEMVADKPFWERVYTKIKEIDCSSEKFGFRSGMRIALIQTICVENLNL